MKRNPEGYKNLGMILGRGSYEVSVGVPEYLCQSMPQSSRGISPRW